MSGRKSRSTERYPRFDRGQRFEHGLLIVSFTALAISGLPQKYPDAAWGEWMIWLMGGIETTRLIHHASAIVLIVSSIYHLATIGYRLLVQRVEWTMLPGWKDVVDAVQSLGYNLRLTKEPPKPTRPGPSRTKRGASRTGPQKRSSRKNTK